MRPQGGGGREFGWLEHRWIGQLHVGQRRAFEIISVRAVAAAIRVVAPFGTAVGARQADGHALERPAGGGSPPRRGARPGTVRLRSAARRVVKELGSTCRSRWSPNHSKKKPMTTKSDHE